eukprot:5883747-Ditylum_brightwellii.AAC.1
MVAPNHSSECVSRNSCWARGLAIFHSRDGTDHFLMGGRVSKVVERVTLGDEGEEGVVTGRRGGIVKELCEVVSKDSCILLVGYSLLPRGLLHADGPALGV